MMNKLQLLKPRSKAAYEKVKLAIGNNRGDMKTAGKILISCIVIVAVLGITAYALNWSKEKVEDTTRQVDTEYQKWSK